MKKIFFLATILVTSFSFCQNTFPINGNVGIGTTTPSSKFEIDTNSQNTLTAALVLKGRTSDETGINGTMIGFQTEASASNLLKAGIAFVRKGGYGTGNLHFLINSNIDTGQVQLSDAKMSILTNGNVGIGTTNPVSKLDIYSNSVTTLKISTGDPSAYSTEIQLGGSADFTKSAIISAPNAAGWYRQDLFFCLANGNNTSSANLSDAAMVIKSYNSGQFGYVGIGTATPDSKLTVKGKIHAEEVKIDLAVPADYVFEKYYLGKSSLKPDYTLLTLSEVEKFTEENHHLPNVPSAKEIKENGLLLGEMSNILLQKIEELTLYSIDQQKTIEKQATAIEKLEKENELFKKLEERLIRLETKK